MQTAGIAAGRLSCARRRKRTSYLCGWWIGPPDR